MFVVKKVVDFSRLLNHLRKQQKTIGFVPTMGALHEGHLSLIEKSAAGNDITVCSIFVNPTQFNNPDDLTRYPRPLEQDIELLSKTDKCNILFAPDDTEMYPEKVAVPKHYDLGFLETILEGKYRPGHFQGVAHIVHQLLQIVAPNNLYMGQKDFQQCMVIKRLIALENLKTNLVICPIKREEDGLAMSSRNRLLSPEQRKSAVLLYQCLISIQAQKKQKPYAIVQKECWDILEQKGFKPDYVTLANAETLTPLDDYDDSVKMVGLIAAGIGDVRLIDNMII